MTRYFIPRATASPYILFVEKEMELRYLERLGPSSMIWRDLPTGNAWHQLDTLHGHLFLEISAGEANCVMNEATLASAYSSVEEASKSIDKYLE
jgi:hypothetical protein